MAHSSAGDPSNRFLHSASSSRRSSDVSRRTEWDGYVETHPRRHCRSSVAAGVRSSTSVFGHECEYLVARRGVTRRRRAAAGAVQVAAVRPVRGLAAVPELRRRSWPTTRGGDGAGETRDGDRAGASARRTSSCGTCAASCPDLPFRQHKLRLTRPLPATTEELWKRLDRKVRNQVRKAQKEGLTVVERRRRTGRRLLRRLRAEHARPGHAGVSQAALQRDAGARSRIAPECSSCGSRTRPVAASIALRFRDSVLVPWASSLREYRRCVRTCSCTGP